MSHHTVYPCNQGGPLKPLANNFAGIYILKNTSPQHQSSQPFGRKILKENEKKEEILIENCEKRKD
jgi:hypothetical protein